MSIDSDLIMRAKGYVKIDNTGGDSTKSFDLFVDESLWMRAAYGVQLESAKISFDNAFSPAPESTIASLKKMIVTNVDAGYSADPGLDITSDGAITLDNTTGTGDKNLVQPEGV